MKYKMDIILINPGDREQVYQKLGGELSAIEPPYWIAVIAAYLRYNGFSVNVIDSNAEGITADEISTRVNELDPLLSAVIVYGSNPSASTPNMTIAGKVCKALKKNTASKVAIGGLHPSALPRRTLQEEDVDFVVEGEGFYTLRELIKVLRSETGDYSKVPGLWYYEGDAVVNTKRVPLMESLDAELPVAAWDLLPMRKYRAHNWHCFDNIKNRAPYAVIYTSFGCPYKCEFCCINAVYGGPGIRYRSPKNIIAEIDYLVKRYGIKNLKIADELFILNERHYMAIAELIIQRGYNLNIWAYARVDSIKSENLKKMKIAGINWLALGIESANGLVRAGVNKDIKTKDIKGVIKTIQDNGISVGTNYIFGLPDDTRESMEETLDLALELNTELANFYCAMAYPGSRLYGLAIERGWGLPEEWVGHSQYAKEALPLPTKYLSAKEVLSFRDRAVNRYYTNQRYLDMIEKRFGVEVKEHLRMVAEIKLQRN